jgi:hypothetical protein
MSGQRVRPTGTGEGFAMEPPDSNDELLRRTIVRLNGNIVGLVLAILGAVIIFVSTNWLVIKGGERVGPHLALLSQFFIGYSVSFTGSLVGAAYALVIGYVGGRLIAWLYNAIAWLRHGWRDES